mmetsp:Transcript_65819/g.176366  ORF Transcript_65819/g.176366 Transcript_65819/m.176366 type:complete len:193 (+) Transcript_65819:71-649(+)
MRATVAIFLVLCVSTANGEYQQFTPVGVSLAVDEPPLAADEPTLASMVMTAMKEMPTFGKIMGGLGAGFFFVQKILDICALQSSFQRFSGNVTERIDKVVEKIEHQMVAMEMKMAANISAAEARLESRLSALENRLEGRFALVDARQDGRLEQMLRDFTALKRDVEEQGCNLSSRMAYVEGATGIRRFSMQA